MVENGEGLERPAPEDGFPIPEAITSGEFARWSWQRRLETIRRMFDDAAARVTRRQEGDGPGDG